MIPLFAYGTLRDWTWRHALLGAEYPAEPATLPGWERVALPGYGYLSIRRNPAAAVDGVLIALDSTGRETTDAWEEVPRYGTVAVNVHTAHGTVAAFAYVYAGEHDGAEPFGDTTRFAALCRDDVEREIAAFAARRDAIRARSAG